MKWFPKSIRWRLQLWYGLILLMVLGAFGFVAVRLENTRQVRQVDQELLERVSVLAAALRPMTPRERELGGPGGPAGPGGAGGLDGERRRMGPGQGPGAGPGPGPGPGKGPPRMGPGGGEGPSPEDWGRRMGPRLTLRLAPEDAVLFNRSGAGGVPAFYFVLWTRDGRVLERSANAPEDVPQPERTAAGAAPSVRTRGELREAYLFFGTGDCVLAGRTMAPDLAEMRRRTGWLVLAGAGVLGLGLAGGGWLAARAIRPVETISATAARISSGELSQRIDLAETESELGRLAAVLNSTFERLEAAFAQQAQFTSDAAHELRTPVTVILTQAQMALGRERSPAEYRETLEACQRAAQRMRRLIESLLALARLDAGQERLNRASFDLVAIVRDCVELVRPLAAERAIQLEVELPEALPGEGDGERLAQVFTNLLTNAIQYNRDGGAVRVAGERQEGLLVVTVADTGQGIPEADMPRVFDRFYRADRSRTGGANAGLGLAISQAIVAAHGGNIDCRSEFGVGTTFTVRLPG